MRYLMIAFFALMAFVSNGQDSTFVKADTTEINLGDTRVIIVSESGQDNKKKTTTHHGNKQPIPKAPKKRHKNTRSMWGGLQLGFSNFDGEVVPAHPQYTTDDRKNRSIAINLFTRRFDLGTPYVGISTGIGFAFNRYALNYNGRLSYDDKVVRMIPETDQKFDKNYLRTMHITAPLLLELNSHRQASKGFRLAVGIEAGYLVKSKTKVVYKDDSGRHVEKVKGHYNMETLRLAPMAMLGYRHFSFYAKYAITPFFKKDKGPDYENGYSHTSFGLFWNFH